MKTAVIYARYSSDSQTEQSIEGQLRVCQQYAKNNDILIVDTYVDRAMTGTNDARPDFQRMIRDSNKRQWNFVIVYKLDRFSRNKYEATIHKHTLKENGVKIISAMENIPDTPEGIPILCPKCPRWLLQCSRQAKSGSWAHCNCRCRKRIRYLPNIPYPHQSAHYLSH